MLPWHRLSPAPTRFSSSKVGETFSPSSSPLSPILVFGGQFLLLSFVGCFSALLGPGTHHLRLQWVRKKVVVRFAGWLWRLNRMFVRHIQKRHNCMRRPDAKGQAWLVYWAIYSLLFTILWPIKTRKWVGNKHISRA